MDVIGRDLIGECFGLLDVKAKTDCRPFCSRNAKGSHYECQCRGCGTIVLATRRQLLRKKRRSCASDQCRKKLRAERHGSTRQCEKCGSVKPLSEMARKRRWRHSRCLTCDNSVKTKKATHRQIIAAIVDHYGCMNPECPWTGPIVRPLIDFHHKDMATKRFCISAAKKRSARELLAEISKCISLCANCHRLHHAGMIDLANVPTCDPGCGCLAHLNIRLMDVERQSG
jgi:hypothetical protein